MDIVLTPGDWLNLFLHFTVLSLLAIGGAITTAPEMHRYLVGQQQWLTDAQFTASIALSQAAPGPNLLFVALLGWNIGLNSAGGAASGTSAWGWGVAGVVIAMTAILIPSSTLTYVVTRWAHRNRERRGVKAFKQGMAPVVIALLMATGWLLSAAHSSAAEHWRLWLLTALATLMVWKTRVHLLALIVTGGLLGAFGLV